MRLAHYCLKIKDRMQLLEASKLRSIHHEQSVPPSTAFSLKEEEGRERLGVRGREENDLRVFHFRQNGEILGETVN